MHLKPDTARRIRMIDHILQLTELLRDEPEGYELAVREVMSRFFLLLRKETEEVRAAEQKGNERDQNWLKSLLGDSKALPYVRMEMALDKAAIRQDLAKNRVNEAELKPFEIVVAPSAKVKVSRIRKDAEINALIAEARKEAEAEERDE